ncbi:MAG: glycosyltransferase family 4 protein [Bacteroidales bacterium]
MKVLWFSNTSCNASEYLGEGPVGGSWLKSLDRTLQNEVDLHVAFYYPKRDDTFKYLKTTYHPISKGNWKLKAILGIFLRNTSNKEELEKYLGVIRQINPDIIHIHGTENPFACIIPFVNTPVVVSVQGCITVYHHKFLAGFSLRDLKLSIYYRGKGFRSYIRNKSFNRIYKDFEALKDREQRNLRSTQYIIGRTAWDKRITSVLAPKRLYYHGDELLRDPFYSTLWNNVADRSLVVHTTTSNSAYKGFETLCEALYILKQEVDQDVVWQIAGLSQHDAIVKIAKKKLGDRFPLKGLLFLGSLDANKLAEAMGNANIYVSASHIENSPNNLCEAMIIGMPCIATYAGGTASLISDGSEGIIVQDGDPWVLAGSIIELYRNPTMAVEFGKNARLRALKRHDHKRIVHEYISTYRSIIENHRSS